MRVSYAQAVHGIEEENAVLDVLRKNQSIMGHRVKQFEEEIATIFGKKHGVMVNSGSSANLLALEILNLPAGSEVITPALTFATTVAPILQRGLKPVFVDVEHGTYNIDISKIREKITHKTKVLMIPSLIGNFSDLDELRKIAWEYNLVFIEDSCDTLGAQYKGLPSGSYSHMSTTSFYGSHIITAAGGGGMICVNNPYWMDQCKILRGWGRSSARDEGEDLHKRFGVTLAGIQYDSKFIFESIGYNFLPLEISAAFGLEQVKKLPIFAETRQKNFNQLFDFFLNYQKYFILPKQLPEAKTNWLGFPLTIKSTTPFDREEITTFLENNNIQTRPVFTGDILRQPAFEHLVETTGQKATDFPVADEVMRRGFLIGCHHGLSQEQMDYLIGKIESFLKNY
ncbi:aminotransferase class I/II-fold pyridoxal phosphate-dependent enzyme [Candidatus Pacearchaeota archaeon]|nr:aminotransferase class I/II-fold pyridoxal phosphate-dependent enzyme [Candidatus Pacearchaeota archaeon]